MNEMRTRAIILLVCFVFFYPYSYGQKLSPIGVFQMNDSSAYRLTIYKVAREKAVCFKAGLGIDASGSPRAYSPSNLGLLDKNGGKDPLTKKWTAVVKKKREPVYQDGSCVYPGFFVSKTSLKIKGYKRTDYRRYVDSDSIPYIALPRKVSKKMNLKLGDIALVYNTKNKKYCYAVFANVVSKNAIGQGSIRLAHELGLNVYLNKHGRIKGGEEQATILYVLFPGSGRSCYKLLDMRIVNDLGERVTNSQGEVQPYAEGLLSLIKD
jgi:hypothetical protein